VKRFVKQVFALLVLAAVLVAIWQLGGKALPPMLLHAASSARSPTAPAPFSAPPMRLVRARNFPGAADPRACPGSDLVAYQTNGPGRFSPSTDAAVSSRQVFVASAETAKIVFTHEGEQPVLTQQGCYFLDRSSPTTAEAYFWASAGDRLKKLDLGQVTGDLAAPPGNEVLFFRRTDDGKFHAYFPDTGKITAVIWPAELDDPQRPYLGLGGLVAVNDGIQPGSPAATPVWLARLSGAKVASPRKMPFGGAAPSVSPDGRRVCVVSDAEAGAGAADYSDRIVVYGVSSGTILAAYPAPPADLSPFGAGIVGSYSGGTWSGPAGLIVGELAGVDRPTAVALDLVQRDATAPDAGQ
jgi:hypothetical protein